MSAKAKTAPKSDKKVSAPVRKKIPKSKAKPAEKKEAPKKDKSGGPSKADLARAIFDKMKDKPRKDVIQAFMDEAKLTKAGASTYYANIKKAAAK